jgi:hypothetical protein
VQGPAEAEALADAEVEADAEGADWGAAGVEQAARVSRRPAAARELAAALRVLVNVTCQG